MVPCGMRPDKPTVLSPRDRLHMLNLSIFSMIPKNFPISSDSTEVDFGRYIPTRELMNLYRTEYPLVDFYIVIGSDLVASLHLWDNFEELIIENKFIIYLRIPFNSNLNVNNLNFKLLSDSVFTCVLSNASSSEARRRIRHQSPLACVGLLPLPVIDFIIDNNLYR